MSVRAISTSFICLIKVESLRPWQWIRLATRVLVVALVTFLMTQQRTHTICNPKLITIFERLEINLKGQSDCKVPNFIISLDKGSSSDPGYNCEAKLSREHF